MELAGHVAMYERLERKRGGFIHLGLIEFKVLDDDATSLIIQGSGLGVKIVSEGPKHY